MIYSFEGPQEKLIEERISMDVSGHCRLYLWKAKDGQVGFDKEEQSLTFVQEFLSNSFSILFPSVERITSKVEVEKNINNLKGLSFWGDDAALIQEYEDFEYYSKQKKKNELLKRYNKPLIDLEDPELSLWNKEGKYGQNLKNFVEKVNLKCVIWDWSDFGIYFFQPTEFQSIYEDVSFMSNKLGIELVFTSSIYDLPYH